MSGRRDYEKRELVKGASETHTYRLVRLPAILLLAGALIACGSGSGDKTSSSAPSGAAGADGGSVNVLGIWGSSELDSFNAMVAGWNGKVNFTGSREITSLLTTRVEGNSPPDVALPAEIGLFQRFAKDGKLT